MGRLAIGGLGAAAGFAIGGPAGAQFGFAAGSLIGGALFAPKGKDQVNDGPRLQSLRSGTSRYGKTKVRVKGRFVVAGEVIWSEDIEEHVQSQTESVGKGGGGPEVTNNSYSYTCTWANFFSLGEIEQVRRIWFDSKLMYDMRPEASAATRAASQAWAADHMDFFAGTETQSPSGVIVAKEGSGNVNAMLGDCYCVFENIPLDDFGKRRPHVMAEVLSAAGQSQWVAAAETGENGIVWSIPSMSTVAAHLNGTLSQTFDCRFSTDKSRLAVCGSPGTPGVNVFKTSDWSQLPDPSTALGSTGRVLRYHPDGSLLAVGCDASPWWRIYDTADMSIAATPATSPGAAVVALAFSPDGKYCAVGTTSGGSGVILEIYLVDGWKALGIAGPPTPSYGVKSLVFSPDSSILVAGMEWGAQLLVYDVATWTLLGSPPSTPTNKAGNDVTFSPDGVYFAVGQTFSPYVQVWTTASALGSWVALAAVSNPPNWWGNAVSFSEDSSEMAVVSGKSGTGEIARYKVSDWSRYADPATPPLTAGNGVAYDVGRVWPLKISLQEIVSEICEGSGLTADDYDVSALLGFEDGFVYGGQSARSAIENLAIAGLFQAVLSDGKIKFVPRGLDSGVTIDAEEMVVMGNEPPLEIVNPDELELPRRLSLTFPQMEKRFEQGEAHQQRLITESTEEASLEVRVAMSHGRAYEIADIALMDLWASRRFKFILPMEFLYLDPGDVVTLTEDAQSWKVRITSMAIEELSRIRCEGIEENLGLWESNAVGAGGPADSGDVLALPATTAIMLDIPMLLDNQNDPRLHYALVGIGNDWYGGLLYRSSDGGTTYAPIATKAVTGVAGTVDTTLPSGITHTWDDVSTVDLTLDDTTKILESVSDLAVLNGANACVIGVDSRWEVIQFATATLIGTGQYRLSRLLRGRVGTEHNVGNHTGSDRFVMLGKDLLGSTPVNISELNVARLYKGVTVSQDPALVSGSAYTYTGVNLKPYSPVQADFAWDPSDDVTLTWVRRSRFAAAMLQEPIVGETELKFEVDILDGETVLNTYTVTAASFSYTAAMQGSDGLSAGVTFNADIYQISEIVGRGQGLRLNVHAKYPHLTDESGNRLTDEDGNQLLAG